MANSADPSQGQSPAKGAYSMRLMPSPITLAAWLAAVAGCVVHTQPDPYYQGQQPNPQGQNYQPPPSGSPPPPPLSPQPDPQPLPPPVTSTPAPADYPPAPS